MSVCDPNWTKVYFTKQLRFMGNGKVTKRTDERTTERNICQ